MLASAISLFSHNPSPCLWMDYSADSLLEQYPAD